MAMTYAQNYGSEKNLSELLLYQFMKQAVSSPGLISNFYGEIVPFRLLIRDQQNLQLFPTIYIIKKRNNLITVREQLLLISAFFGFSKTKLAEIFGVTRQSVHNWFDNADVSNEHCEKIKRLADVVREVVPEPSQQIFHAYINDLIDGYNKSLLEYILADDFDKDIVVKLSKTIYEMSIERWKRIDAIPKAKYKPSESTIP